MDELDELESLYKVDDSGDIKHKILFSVLVVSTIIFVCIYSCDSFKKVVIIYLKWVKRLVRTPRESAWGNFFREKATFCEDERLVEQMISVRQLTVTDASRSAKRHLRLKKIAAVTTWPILRRSWLQSLGESTLACVASVSLRFRSSFHFLLGQHRKSH